MNGGLLLFGEFLRGRGQRIRHRMPEVGMAVAVEIDAVIEAP